MCFVVYGICCYCTQQSPGAACSVVQCKLLHVLLHCSTVPWCSALHVLLHSQQSHVQQYTIQQRPCAAWCSGDNATHCSTLQHTKPHCNTLLHMLLHYTTEPMCSVMFSTHCCTLQQTATHCNTLSHKLLHHTTVPMCSVMFSRAGAIT